MVLLDEPLRPVAVLFFAGNHARATGGGIVSVSTRRGRASMSAAHPPFMSAAPALDYVFLSRQPNSSRSNATTVSRWPTRTAAISVLG